MDLTEVIQANNGAEALAMLRESASSNSAFDLIMSDINMPVMDGLEFIEQRKKEGLAPGVPAVMITTEGSTPNVMRALAAGAKGYICKPFTTDQIKACVMPLLNAA
jgi:two-component system chemotaxis response regulator CheY